MVTVKDEKLKFIRLQDRDITIFEYLNRVGYANLEQITIFLTGDNLPNNQNAVMKRIYTLKNSDYLKIFRTHKGNYYTLTNKSKMSNQLIMGVRLDQLPHHDFLIALFEVVRKSSEVMTEREVLAKYKTIGKKGKIPDMIIDDWNIEYERTPKSNADCKSLLDYWIIEHDTNVCIIYEDPEIRNRYMRYYHNYYPGRIRLIAKDEYTKILSALKEPQDIPVVKEEDKEVKKFGNFVF